MAKELAGKDFDSQVLPHLYRVFKGTVQRVPPLISSLNSHAAFLLVIESHRKIQGWCGSSVSKADFAAMKDVAGDIYLRDFGDKSSPGLSVILEGSEVPEVLEKFLSILWTIPGVYFNRITVADRRALIHNNAVSVGHLVADVGKKEKFDVRETAFAHPDSNGTVPRVTFPAIDVKTIVYMNIGDQWDLWFSRGVSKAEREAATAFVIEFIETQAQQIAIDNPGAIDHAALRNYLTVVEQGDEGVLFRRLIKIFTDFEPAGKTLVQSTKPNPLQNLKAIAQEGTVKTDATGKASTPSAAQDKRASKKTRSAAPLVLEDPIIRQEELEPEEDNRVDFWHDVSAVKGKGKNSLGHRQETLDEDDIAPPSRLQVENGRVQINPHMVRIIESQNVSIEQRQLVMSEACSNPVSLLGWQVEIDEGLFKGVFVVVGCKKTMLSRKSTYHLAAMHGDEFWIRLKRGQKKSGVRFRPLRQVAILQ